jgi:fimbrial chaperone protein
MAAEFSVSPVRIYLDSARQIETVTVSNASNDELTLQVSFFEWSQDEQAKDVYSPTEDIVVFPKMLSVRKGEDRVLRVGARVPPGGKEKTYRIYLEEIPRPGAEGEGATVRTLMKVGVPVFISPVGGVARGEIDEAALSGGALRFRVRNDGDAHLLIRGISVEGTDAGGIGVFRKQVAGWYLLEGRSRVYSVEIPKEECLKAREIRIDVDTDKLSLDRSLDVLPEMCR